MPTFGETNIGTTDDTQGLNTKEVCAFTCNTTGPVQKITGRISGQGAPGSQPMRAVIYVDSAGNPGALVGQSNEIVIADGAPYAWVDFPFSAPPIVTSGVIYWLGFIGGAPDAASQIRGFTNGTVIFNADTYADGASNPFGAPSTFPNFHYSVYATVGGGGGGGDFSGGFGRRWNRDIHPHS